MTINTISQLVNNTWSPITYINTNKPDTPLKGSIFHDPGVGKTYVFDGVYWKEVSISYRNGNFNKVRMRKIKNLFKICIGFFMLWTSCIVFYSFMHFVFALPSG